MLAALLGGLAAPCLAAGPDPRTAKTKRPPSYFRPRVEIICIDDVSVAKYGPWPFDRKWHAKLVNRLVAAGARAIAFDLYFGRAETAGGDRQFADAVRRSKRTWLITNPTTAEQDEPRRPLAILASAAGWRIADANVPNDLRFVGGIPLKPLGKSKSVWNVCVALMAEYVHLKRWPYPSDDGESYMVDQWALPASGGTFTSDGKDARRMALDADSWVRLNSYAKVLRPDYDMRRFRNAIVIVGLTAQNLGEQVIFDNWNAPQWTFKYHVEALGIFTEKMLRHLHPPQRLPAP